MKNREFLFLFQYFIIFMSCVEKKEMFLYIKVQSQYSAFLLYVSKRNFIGYFIRIIFYKKIIVISIVNNNEVFI